MKPTENSAADFRDLLFALGRMLGGEGVLALREGLLELAKNQNPLLREAGRSWSAALGGALMLIKESNVDSVELSTQIEQLFSRGFAAWLAYGEQWTKEAKKSCSVGNVGIRAMQSQSVFKRDKEKAELFTVLQSLSEVCKTGREALSGDESAWSRFDTHVKRATESMTQPAQRGQ